MRLGNQPQHHVLIREKLRRPFKVKLFDAIGIEFHHLTVIKHFLDRETGPIGQIDVQIDTVPHQGDILRSQTACEDYPVDTSAQERGLCILNRVMPVAQAKGIHIVFISTG